MCVFTQLEANRKTCVQVRLDRWYPVANMTIQHSLKVYDYYEPGTVLTIVNHESVRLSFVTAHNIVCMFSSVVYTHVKPIFFLMETFMYI